MLTVTHASTYTASENHPSEVPVIDMNIIYGMKRPECPFSHSVIGKSHILSGPQFSHM